MGAQNRALACEALDGLVYGTTKKRIDGFTRNLFGLFSKIEKFHKTREVCDKLIKYKANLREEL